MNILQLPFASTKLAVKKMQLVINQYHLLNVALNYLLFHMLHLDNVYYALKQVNFSSSAHTL